MCGGGNSRTPRQKIGSLFSPIWHSRLVPRGPLGHHSGGGATAPYAVSCQAVARSVAIFARPRDTDAAIFDSCTILNVSTSRIQFMPHLDVPWVIYGYLHGVSGTNSPRSGRYSHSKFQKMAIFRKIFLEWFRGQKWQNPRLFIWPGKYATLRATARQLTASGAVAPVPEWCPRGSLGINLGCPMGENRDPVFVPLYKYFSPTLYE